MSELPPFLLAIAFALVGLAAWLLGRRSAAARTVRLPRDYYIGLDHLINDRFDHATEAFARIARADTEAVEMQFALGSLFRRRGEVDRAIAIHSRLRDAGRAAERDRASFELALDYLSAGLMDHAERLFEELTASREHRAAALDQLLRICEQQRDWAKALKVFQRLPPELQYERRREAAHYLCELAEHALSQGETERAESFLNEARRHHTNLPRVDLLTARALEQGEHWRAAFQSYLKAVEATPGLALHVIPPLMRLAERLNEPHAMQALAERLRRHGGVSHRQLAWLLATAMPREHSRKAASLGRDAHKAEQGASRDASASEVLLTRSDDANGRYQCDECGLQSVSWYWRCPKCRAWDSMHPAVLKWMPRLEEAGVR